MIETVVSQHDSDLHPAPAPTDHATGLGLRPIAPSPARGILAARPGLPRPLLKLERQALAAVLSHTDFHGCGELRRQAIGAEVLGYCDCGCASVRLGVRGDASAAPLQPGPLPVHAVVLDRCQQPIGRIVVYVAAPGRLWLLEITGQAQPNRSLPADDQLLFRCSSPGGRR